MQDPLRLNITLAGVDATLPLLPEADYLVQVKESSIDPNKDQNGLNWNLKLGIVNPATAVDGRAVNPDYPVFAVYALQAKADSKDPEAFKRSLCEAIDALLGTNKDTRPDLTQALLTEMVGKQCVAHVIIDEYQGNKNNKVRRLKVAA